eukprot:TRINITY_DN99882_c0_g1_i1.p1 TRINITY_DN99882_c0_g1~~TRINITY_DN99882_c0_g1_i1.p1  ORF type:complete len:286 (-),score=66.85 TRINITY_DN99882_c0_g1_i1:157-1014(-)
MGEVCSKVCGLISGRAQERASLHAFQHSPESDTPSFTEMTPPRMPGTAPKGKGKGPGPPPPRAQGPSAGAPVAAVAPPSAASLQEGAAKLKAAPASKPAFVAPPTGAELRAAAGKLKAAETRPGAPPPMDAAVESMAKLYTENSGDAAKLAALCGISAALITKHPPASAEDFAHKLLEGVYTDETVREIARKSIKRSSRPLAPPTAADLQAAAGHLRHAEPAAEIVEDPTTIALLESMARIYVSNAGDLDKIAEICGCNPSLMTRDPPSSAQDFASKILEGRYSD